MTSVTRSSAQGGLEGLQPSKKSPFLVVVAHFAGNHHQKNKLWGGKASSNPFTAYIM
jgi:hypothetical protein